MREEAIEYVVLGLGLNVNWSPDRTEEVSHIATSILAETGSSISRNDLLVTILRIFESYYREVLSGQIDVFYRTWNEASAIIGGRWRSFLPRRRPVERPSVSIAAAHWS